MDAFYASVEVRRRPELAGRPVLVGGTGGRGVVASASYEARALGVTSAMPMARALRLCPDAAVIAPDFAAYQAVSAELGRLFRRVTPLVEPLSLDEAFLDVAGSTRLFGEPVAVGHLLRRWVRQELRLPISVGVAGNKLLAKLCSGKAKPDGLLHLRTEEVGDFLAPLPVADLWGVGEQTAAKLARFGIRTVAELAATPQPTLSRLLGPAAGAHLAQVARGEDPRPVVSHSSAKSMSAEETIERDVDDPERLKRTLLRLSDTVARRLRAGGVAGRTVTLKLRYADFRTITRSRTLPGPTDETTALHGVAADLVDGLRLQRVRVRLIGLGVSGLAPVDAAGQLDLLGDDRWQRIDRASDAARERFGDGSLTRGALLDLDEDGWPPAG